MARIEAYAQKGLAKGKLTEEQAARVALESLLHHIHQVEGQIWQGALEVVGDVGSDRAGTDDCHAFREWPRRGPEQRVERA